jgi:hypothetical protein
MTNWCFFISFLSFENFLFGFHYRKGIGSDEEGSRELEIHELGIGILSIGIERYK